MYELFWYTTYQSSTLLDHIFLRFFFLNHSFITGKYVWRTHTFNFSIRCFLIEHALYILNSDIKHAVEVTSREGVSTVSIEYHYIIVTWVWWHTKSMATRLCVQKIVHNHNKQNIKATFDLPFREGNPWRHNAKGISTSRRNHIMPADYPYDSSIQSITKRNSVWVLPPKLVTCNPDRYYIK